MAVVRKAPVIVMPGPTYQKELELLYARRSAIEALIESLEDYERFLKSSAGKRKTA
jgi:hypothetical protein